jgi:hypothetical protein
VLEGARFTQVTDWSEIDDPIAATAIDAGCALVSASNMKVPIAWQLSISRGKEPRVQTSPFLLDKMF